VFWYNDKQKKVSRNKLNIEYISQKAQLIDNLIPITVREVVNM
jgi:ABC-type Mn2+/Zn2+ transport system ATPase subunit